MRYLGIDYGAKRTGLAVCDRGGSGFAGCAYRAEGLIEQIARVVQEQEIEVVVGCP